MSRSCIYAGEGDPAEVHSEQLRRARKGHACGECEETINKGDLYEVSKGKWEGEWSTFKTCARCLLIRDDYFSAWTYGCLVGDFEAEHGFDYREGIPADFTPCEREPTQ